MAADPTAGPRRTPGVGAPAFRPAVPGLLDHVTGTSLDEDYAHVSARRAASGAPAPRRGGTGAMVALAVFGVLVATAAVQTSRNADESARSRHSLLEQVADHRTDLAQRRTRSDRLSRQVASMQTTNLAVTTQAQAEQQRVQRLGVLTGRAVSHGPGVRVTVDDAPGATSAKQQVQAPDLQKLVNGLWQVGAEGVSINGQRLTALSPIRDAAGAVTVNFRSLHRPYVVQAVGDPKKMGAALLDTAGGQTWLTLESSLGLKFAVDTEETMTLPAAPSTNLRYARPVPGHSGGTAGTSR